MRSPRKKPTASTIKSSYSSKNQAHCAHPTPTHPMSANMNASFSHPNTTPPKNRSASNPDPGTASCLTARPQTLPNRITQQTGLTLNLRPSNDSSHCHYKPVLETLTAPWKLKEKVGSEAGRGGRGHHVIGFATTRRRKEGRKEGRKLSVCLSVTQSLTPSLPAAAATNSVSWPQLMRRSRRRRRRSPPLRSSFLNQGRRR